MQLQVGAGPIAELAADAVVLFSFEGEGEWSSLARQVNAYLDGGLMAAVSRQSFKAECYTVLALTPMGKQQWAHVFLVGLGKRERFDRQRLHRGVATGLRRAQQVRAEKVAVCLPEDLPSFGINAKDAGQLAALGAWEGTYRYDELKSHREEGSVQEIFFILENGEERADFEKGLAEGDILGQAVCFARTLTNRPANHNTPQQMADAALEQAKAVPEVQAEVLGREAMQQLGMGALLGVASGSVQEPKLIVLRYDGAPQHAQRLALVGKGVCFDSGGISLKQAKGMSEMKDDMAGGAACIAALLAIAQLHLPINVVAVVPAVENMPSGTAQHPGDVQRTMSGQTVEVDNTDAEGRLILCDALTYAQRELKATHVVDVATLTGAQVVALGYHRSAVMGFDQAFMHMVLQAADEAGEKMWPLPSDEEYDALIRSHVADICNVANQGGAGTIVAGMFLGRFIEEGRPWAHIDIAGPAFLDFETPYQAFGATGTPVATFVHLAMHLAS
ncbi:MAG: leucyl aminopeptidase [Firmicutes bacterium]|nr:leucyl aminopeptidase [Bacillota bacterium]